MPTKIISGDATNGLIIESSNDGALVIQSGLAGAKVDALTISAGGLVTVPVGFTSLISTAVAFPATQVASANANTLDDYEEGTWTSTFTTTDTNFTGAVNTFLCHYVKIGRVVTITGGAVLLGLPTGGTGDIVITGLPFVVQAPEGYGVFYPGRITLSGTLGYVIYVEGVNIYAAYLVTGANPVSLPASAFNGNSSPYFSINLTYFTN